MDGFEQTKLLRLFNKNTKLTNQTAELLVLSSPMFIINMTRKTFIKMSQGQSLDSVIVVLFYFVLCFLLFSPPIVGITF